MTTSEQTAGGVDWSQLATWPNLVTLLRLCCLPLFLYLLFGPEERGMAAWLLAGLGATDWVDGWLARILDQKTEFGAMFDPIVDRLLFVAAVPALLIDGSLPLLVGAVILLREALVSSFAVALRLRGASRLVVTWEGKTGTFFLLFAVPMFLGAASTLPYAGVLEPLAWLFTIPGLAYGWYAALFQYLPATRASLASQAQ
ncbi:MAG: CDP-alcohol phosphatidyltransferase family protein [Actinomycetota bacterium]